MFCLVYRSKANPVFGSLQIKEMLEKARKYNKNRSITGCLLLYNGNFIQYLEGNQIQVLALFDKIKNDIRHSEINLLSHDIIEEREFEDWKMAFEFLSNENSQLQYLKLLVSSFFENSASSLTPNPTSLRFWRATKLLLQTKSKKSQRN